MFDVNQFTDMQINEANDTVLRPVPEGEYIAIIASYEVRPWTGKEDPTKSGVALDIQWEIDDAALQADLGRKPKVKHGVMLDLSEDGQGLDMGKGRNVGLGRLRQALGLNVPGKPFSFSQLPGQAARIAVKHRQDKNDPEKVYAEVREVTGL